MSNSGPDRDDLTVCIPVPLMLVLALITELSRGDTTQRELGVQLAEQVPTVLLRRRTP